MGFVAGVSLAFFIASSNFFARMSSLLDSWNQESANLSSRLRFSGIREFVFALAVLLGKNSLGVRQVHIGSGLHGRFVRKHRAEHCIHHQLCLAARARHVQIFAGTISHEIILHPFAPARVKAREFRCPLRLEMACSRGTLERNIF